MEKKSLCMGLALGIGCLSFFAIINAFFYHFTHITMDVNLQNNIETTIETNSTIDFSKVTDFDWDTLYVFTPYSSPNEILNEDDILTFNSNFNIEYLDTIVMLGFVKDHYLVAYVELPRSQVTNLSTISMRFSKDTATFKIRPIETTADEISAKKAIAF